MGYSLEINVNKRPGPNRWPERARRLTPIHNRTVAGASAEERLIESAAAFGGPYGVAHEMKLAWEAQARLFPRRLPPVETLAYAGVCVQARQVGGDYYDFLDLGPGRIGLVVGDVAGKGIAAALLMANLQAILRSHCALASDDLNRLLEPVNRLFRENTRETSYATLFFADYQEDGGRLRYVNCGHPAALLLHRDKSLSRLEPTGTVLGLFEEWQGSTVEVQLAPGDTLLLYTDGVTEAASASGEEFGEHRLIDLVRAWEHLPVSTLLPTILAAAKRFSGGQRQDDMTLVAARYGNLN